MSSAVQFVLDGELLRVKDVDPTRTVLQYLRENLHRLGTKEGCAEGDCGACTVVLADLNSDKNGLRYHAINSCIQFLPTLHGKALFTVESLTVNGELHPAQKALVQCHGSQCGFCTPGFAMSMFAMSKSATQANRADIDTALSGNLCRCTGYRPIIDAVEMMYTLNADSPATDPLEEKTIALLQNIDAQQNVQLVTENKQFYAPGNLTDFSEHYATHEDAVILAGGTDIGLWVTKQYKDLPEILYLGNVPELKTINVTSSHIDIGAAVTLSDALPVLSEHYPDIKPLMLRFASPPIRNAGTLVGNLANGSPIGDTLPILIALGASLQLRKRDVTREIPLDEFYIDYMQTALTAGEFVERVLIPTPAKNQIVRTYKLSKRFDQDISAVCGAYNLQLSNGTVSSICVAYGGMAATAKRASKCEMAIVGKAWNEATARLGMDALEKDFSPLSDMRATAQYRQTSCKNLLLRFYFDSVGTHGPTDVYSYAP